ncbi:Hypothetical protein NGAL_HAMBI2566_58700 [Neorhizobium galegae bv. orientalis]|nr:Hypothetical protein NGAL_HAMBI2566_58700 [Neorhizobium galegae bv. orientalis]
MVLWYLASTVPQDVVANILLPPVFVVESYMLSHDSRRLSGSSLGISVVSNNQPLWGGLSLGGSLSRSDDRYAVHAEAFARTNLKDFGDSNAVGAKGGFSVKWQCDRFGRRVSTPSFRRKAQKTLFCTPPTAAGASSNS